MEQPVNNGDFVELEYTGRISENNAVFDTTNEETAKSSGAFDPKANYGPVIVCIGAGHLIKGLEKEISGKPLGKRTIHISAEDGFGRKNPKLLQLLPSSKFKNEEIAPIPGLQVNVDGVFGIIKTVSGGRIIVDFNHPLAGKDLDYEIDVKRIISDTNEKLNAILKFYFKDYSADIKDDSAVVELKVEIPKQLGDKIADEISKLIPEIKSVEFVKA